MTGKQRYFIELAYDGTAYHGWQIQQNAVSVQELLNKALATIFRYPVETTGCGRTDTGVHAREFFAHFDAGEVDGQWSIDHSIKGEHTNKADKVDNQLSIDHSVKGEHISKADKVDGQWSIDHNINNTVHTNKADKVDGQWSIDHSINNGLSTIDHGLKIRSINALLPPEIAIKNIIPVHADAHARFDATSRSYQYHIHFNKDPFLHGYSWQVRDVPDIGLMNLAATMIMDYVDFSCFSKSNTQVKTNNCKITRVEWVKTEQGMVFHISADRFLRNMVRAIVGTLMMVGKQEIPPEAVRQIIESKNRSNAGMSVPACGLYLTEVKYTYL